MDISKGTIRIENKQNILPSDIKAIGLGLDGLVIIKYKIANKIHYIQYLPDRKLQTYVFFELLNNSPLIENCLISGLLRYRSTEKLDAATLKDIVTVGSWFL